MPPHRTPPKVFQYAQALRHHLTPAERKLWARLRNHQLDGVGFRRQHAIGPFIADFCCPTHKLVIEVDGSSHANQADYDAQRTAWLIAQRWRVVRFTNREVRENLEGVLVVIRQLLEAGEVQA